MWEIFSHGHILSTTGDCLSVLNNTHSKGTIGMDHMDILFVC
jgi:hypothetical protein